MKSTTRHIRALVFFSSVPGGLQADNHELDEQDPC